MQKRILALLAGACASVILLSADEPALKPVKAASVTSFLNSIGVNSAISARGEHLDKTIEAINYTGIRWVRSGYEGNVPMADYLRLYRETGVKFSYGLMSGGTNIPRLLQGGRELAEAGALLAFEGVNEPNNWPLTYNNEKGGKNLSWLPVAKLQADLYKAVKADAKLQKYPIWSLSENGAQTDNTGLQYLQIPTGAETTMPAGTRYADAANAHNYFSHPSNPGLYDNQTWNAADPGKACKVDGLFGNYGTTWLKKFNGYNDDELAALPRVTTETGVTIGGAFTEEKQARMYLNLYLAQFKRGWSYTSIYLLRDRSDEAGNQSFGFYAKDYTPRKAAIYLHNFTSILQDKASPKKAASLAYAISNCPVTVHDLLLQRSDGKLLLVLWCERMDGSDKVTLKLGNKKGQVKLYDPTIGTSAVKNWKGISELELELSDHPIVLEM